MSLSTSGVLTLSGTVASTSTTSGTLTVAGGVGIRGDVYAGGVIYGNLTGVTTTATNLAAGTTGQIPYQSNPGVTGFFGPGTSGNVLVSNGPATPSYNNTLTLTGSTVANSTNSGALQVVGGVGIGGALYVGSDETILGNLEVRGGDITTNQSTFNLLNANATDINFAGAGTAITIGATTGYTEIKNSTTLTNITNAINTTSGALQVRGGVGIGGNLYVGGTMFINTITGVVTTSSNIAGGTAGQILYQTSPGATSFIGPGTAGYILVSNNSNGPQYQNTLTLTGSNVSLGTTSGALQVVGGVGIGGNLNVGGNSTIANLNATVTTATALTVNGITSITNSENSNSTGNGSVRISGGVGVVKDIYAGGLISAGATQAATTGTTVAGFYTNNTLIASFTSNVITGSGQATLDSFSSAVFRSAKYFVQIVDGTDVHVSEISVFHDGVKSYINEYGIATNNGQLGTFDAIYGSNITIKFTPVSATAMTIKMVRTTITL